MTPAAIVLAFQMAQPIQVEKHYAIGDFVETLAMSERPLVWVDPWMPEFQVWETPDEVRIRLGRGIAEYLETMVECDTPYNITVVYKPAPGLLYVRGDSIHHKTLLTHLYDLKWGHP